MSEDQINKNETIEKINILLEKQVHFENEITELRKELEKIKLAIPIPVTKTVPETIPVNKDFIEPVPQPIKATISTQPIVNDTVEAQLFELKKKAYYDSLDKQKTIRSSQIEKFIGENLINKIGILITIIGVAIGAKYAIDHQLISPLTRIILGYLFGLILFGFAIKLKKDYNNFSSVLMSGAMAIIYFITYAAYSFYALIPLNVTFGLMVLITVFTVYAAIKYDRHVIALIGMVGAYGVPFLLNDGSGNMVVLFTYMSIINLGIMVLAFKRYWKPIYYVSFALSWIIYIAWYTSSYKDVNHFYNAFLFLTIFYFIFYVTYLSYNLIRKELFNYLDVMLILTNSFIFYGIGYALLSAHPGGKEYLGLFTFITAIIQAVVCGLIYKMKLAEWHLFYFLSTLALTFITIAVPVQLSGNWITLLWVGEAGLLFWIGRMKQISVYENISYVLMIMAFFSIIGDWINGYNYHKMVSTQFMITPVINIYFVTSLLFVAVFSFINMLNQNEIHQSDDNNNGPINSIMRFAIPGILITTLFFMFWFEISSYFNQLIYVIRGNDELNSMHISDLHQFRILFLLNYSILFFVGLSVFNIRVLKNKVLGYLNLEINMVLFVVFLIQGLYSLSLLRDSFLHQTSSDLYHPGAFNFYIRYLSFLVVLALLIICYRYVRQEFIDSKLNKAYDIILHFVIVWILSSELITWIDFFGGEQAYKLGLSLLWGGYALLLIVLGIWKQQQHLRISAIVLFSVTLLKLFFYDLLEMGTISKTVVFITLGILLLIISFLYNKYKHLIGNDQNE